MKIYIITPYYKEATQTLRRCHESVLAQTYQDVVHVFVSDGSPNDEIDNWDCLHLKVPNHGDYGDTPRALGGFSAATLGADAMCFLDADNWYEPNHVKTLLDIHLRTKAQVVTATRKLHKADGTVLGICNESDGRVFNDTNCYFITKPTFTSLGAWIFKDHKDAIVGDRVYWDTIQRLKFTREHCMIPTVNYTSGFACHYQAFGLVPPDDTKVIVRFEGKDHSEMITFAEFKKVTGQGK